MSQLSTFRVTSVPHTPFRVPRSGWFSINPPTVMGSSCSLGGATFGFSEIGVAWHPNNTKVENAMVRHRVWLVERPRVIVLSVQSQKAVRRAAPQNLLAVEPEAFRSCV